MDKLVPIIALGLAVLGNFYLSKLSDSQRLIVGVLVTLGYVFVAGWSVWKFLWPRVVRLVEDQLDRVGKKLDAAMTFNPDPETGRLKLGGIPNVAVRIETAHVIFDNLLNNKTMAKDAALYLTGKNVGSQFVKDFTGAVSPGAKSDTIQKQDLDLWARYDGVAGFGRFDFARFNSATVSGFIELKGSFLTHGRSPNATILCPFIGGYIEGWLGVMTGRNLSVTSTCSSKPPGHPTCEFEVKKK